MVGDGDGVGGEVVGGSGDGLWGGGGAGSGPGSAGPAPEPPDGSPAGSPLGSSFGFWSSARSSSARFVRSSADPSSFGTGSTARSGAGIPGSVFPLGDYASLYAALLRAVDPGPVEMIERLKQRLAETGYGRTADPQA